MFSNQSFRPMVAWLTPGVFAGLALAAAGCSTPSPPPQPVVPASEFVADAEMPEASGPELTATETATTLTVDSTVSAPQPQPLMMADGVRSDAPSKYTVQKGDTLWGISNMFLKDPWLWPEIWYVNPEIENPHWIFPGDVLALAYGTDGSVRIVVEQGGAARLNPRLRSTPIDGPIATIPYGAIAAFLSRPTLLSAEEVKNGAHVLAFRDEHMVGGNGQEIYVRNLDAAANSRYAVVHPGEQLRDPDDGDVIGYEGVYTATALVTRPGEPLKALLTESARETLEDDIVISGTGDVPATFEVRIPTTDINGEIISVVDDSTMVGTYQVIAINRGASQGLTPGNVLAIDQRGPTVRDNSRSTARWFNVSDTFSPRVKLPDERSGTALVFKTYERMSYAIIVGAIAPIRVGDIVRTP